MKTETQKTDTKDIKKSGLLYIVKDKKALKQISEVENKATIFLPKYIVHIRFRDKNKIFDTASLLSYIENRNTGKLLDVVFFPVYISNFLHKIKEVSIIAKAIKE